MSNQLSVMTKFVNPLSSNTMLRLCKGVYTTPRFYWSVGVVPLQNARLSRQAIDLLSKCILRLLIKDSHFHFISIYLKNGGNKPTKHKSQTGYKSAFFRCPFAFARPHNNNWHPLKNPLSRAFWTTGLTFSSFLMCTKRKRILRERFHWP